MKSLVTLCEISLMRNYLLLQDVKNVPYRLIKNILIKARREHLCKLEKSNPLIIFEDDELWLNFLKQDFPTSIHDCYVSKKASIKEYYIRFIKENDSDLLIKCEGLINRYLQISVRKDAITNKYKMPYRLLYFRYQLDVEKKQEKSAERLRLQMKQLEKERQRNQTVTVDHSFYAQNQPKRHSTKSRHSDLFKRSIKGHENRLQHFRSGGFDIAKRHTTRVAFGGTAGNSEQNQLLPQRPTNKGPAATHSSTRALSPFQSPPQSPPESPSQSPPHSPPKIKKRRIEPPSIFLSRKRPSLLSNKERSPKPESPPGLQLRSEDVVSERRAINPTTGHRKKSSLFSSPALIHKDSESILTERVGSTKMNTRNVYIFDKTRSENAS